MRGTSVLSRDQLPACFTSVEELENFLSTPTAGLVEDFRKLDGDLLILGVGGKVGPTLAMMAKRAAPEKRVIGVARFSDAAVRERIEAAGMETIACDLLDRRAVAELPKVANVVYMAGKKFGTAGSETLTWAMNTVVPAYVGERFSGTRFVAFSTLCVYPFSRVDGAGATPEDTAPTPLGEYANSCVGRERIFQYFSRTTDSPGRLARLNYAIDCRYGVLMDIALKVRGGEPIDIRTGIANVIWQGDAISHILRCLGRGTTPAAPINIGAPQPAKVREVARRFGEIFGRAPVFSGEEEATAWHNDNSEAQRLFGDPVVDLDTMIRWNADWLERGLPLHHKPTHYEERAGSF
ncbi:MAG: NAD-dependent epimerase/dehydratase family protein [Verrucomicrobia bacterium]|jgi:nucleoside-diphosphate-sugar epimerase|nr:NAD-dependent epimerase/dehydratase family protein [Verrucomicrobiota bacterium]